MVTRNDPKNGAYRRRGHIKTALGIGLRTRPRPISVSPRYIFAWYMYRLRVFLACFISHCYTCIKTLVESEILSSTIP